MKERSDRDITALNRQISLYWDSFKKIGWLGILIGLLAVGTLFFMKKAHYNMTYTSEMVVQVSLKTSDVATVGGNNLEFLYGQDSMKAIMEVVQEYLESDAFYSDVLEISETENRPKISVEVLADKTSLRFSVSSSEAELSEQFLKDSVSLFEKHAEKIIGFCLISPGDIKNTESNILYSTKVFILILLFGFVLSAVITWLHALLRDGNFTAFLASLDKDCSVCLLPRPRGDVSSGSYTIPLMQMSHELLDSGEKYVLLTGIWGERHSPKRIFKDIALFFAGKKKKTLLVNLTDEKWNEKKLKSVTLTEKKIPVWQLDNSPLFLASFSDIASDGKIPEEIFRLLSEEFDSVFVAGSARDVADHRYMKKYTETTVFFFDQNDSTVEQTQVDLAHLKNYGFQVRHLVHLNR